MRSWTALFLTIVALTLIAAPTASAGRVETRTSADYIYLGSLGCGQERSETVRLGPRVESVRILRPTAGHPFHDSTYGAYVGRITAVDVLRAGGRTSVRFTGRGEGATCDVFSSSTFPEQIGYRIRYRYRLAKRELGSCRSVFMYFTRAEVRANGYAGRCTRARSLARAWRRKQSSPRCAEGYCLRVRVGGFRCRLRFPEQSLRVTCRRRRAVVTWAWGD